MIQNNSHFLRTSKAQSDEGGSWIKGSTTDPILISTVTILLPPAGLIWLFEQTIWFIFWKCSESPDVFGNVSVFYCGAECAYQNTLMVTSSPFPGLWFPSQPVLEHSILSWDKIRLEGTVQQTSKPVLLQLPEINPVKCVNWGLNLQLCFALQLWDHCLRSLLINICRGFMASWVWSHMCPQSQRVYIKKHCRCWKIIFLLYLTSWSLLMTVLICKIPIIKDHLD